VIAVLKSAVSMWVMTEHRVRPVRANRKYDLATEDAVILKPSIRVREHDDVFDSKNTSRFRLFFLAHRDNAVARHIVIV
jgi:hypothetical protein